MWKLAIDMGSSMTKIYRADTSSGILLAEPSCVAVVGEERTVKAVGKEAKNLIGKTAEFTSIVYPVYEGEIVDLDYKIKNAVILEVSSDTSYVHIGSKVTVYDEDMDEEETYEITGSTEANAMENKISNESPVGAALLKHKVGDKVKVVAPEGEYYLVVKQIS